MEKVANLLGPNWQSSLLLVGSNGTINPEMILPGVLLNSLQSGLRGIIVVSLIAALMSTLTGTVNGASALFVRDIYQNFLRPKSGNTELITMAYISSLAIIVVSFMLGLSAPSINDLWGWLAMGLTAGALGPMILRFYWWRVNAWGMAAGIFMGGFGAVLQRFVAPGMSEIWQFVIMTSLSFAGVVFVSLLTPETPKNVLDHFYKTTRPFGFWKPFWSDLKSDEKVAWAREHRNDIISTVVALGWQISFLLLPMQFLTRNAQGFWTTLPVFSITCFGLYWFWWRNLPSADEEIADFASQPPPEHDPLTIDAAKDEISSDS